jgi:intracellular septation protein
MIDLIISIAFFAAYKMYNVYIATGLLMALFSLKMAYALFKKQQIPNMEWFLFALVMVFGASTLLFRSEKFIEIKPTILYWGFAVCLEFFYRYRKKNLAELFFKEALSKADVIITKPDVWKKTYHWLAALFWALGLANLVVMMMYDLETWMQFKLFGLGIIAPVGLMAIMFYLFKNQDPKNGIAHKEMS